MKKALNIIWSIIMSIWKTLINFLVIIIWTIDISLRWFWRSLPRTKKDASILLNLIFINYFIIAYAFIPVVGAASKEIFDSLFPKAKVVTIQKEIIVEKELTGVIWVFNRIEEAGLNPIEAGVGISRESGFSNNENKFNINSNSVDLSFWQINTQHLGKEWINWKTGETKELTLSCMTDIYCSTDWSISKRLHDGNWSAWYGFKAAGIK